MSDAKTTIPATARSQPDPGNPPRPARNVQKGGEIGGPSGLEPTRYGDWEAKGRCTDF